MSNAEEIVRMISESVSRAEGYGRMLDYEAACQESLYAELAGALVERRKKRIPQASFEGE
jgi:hypothetical protein